MQFSSKLDNMEIFTTVRTSNFMDCIITKRPKHIFIMFQEIFIVFKIFINRSFSWDYISVLCTLSPYVGHCFVEHHVTKFVEICYEPYLCWTTLFKQECMT